MKKLTITIASIFLIGCKTYEKVNIQIDNKCYECFQTQDSTALKCYRVKDVEFTTLPYIEEIPIKTAD